MSVTTGLRSWLKNSDGRRLMSLKHVGFLGLWAHWGIIRWTASIRGPRLGRGVPEGHEIEHCHLISGG